MTDNENNIEELQKIYTDLFNKDLYLSAIERLCGIAKNNPQDPMERQLILDCITASKIYGYIDSALFQNNDFFNNLYVSDKDFIPVASLETTFSDEYVLTPYQSEVLDLFKEKKKICISAPTSFGKTFVLFEILSQFTGIFKNIVIVVPTIALCTEVFYKINGIEKLKQTYNIINYYDINMDYSSSDNIFILTPEKTDILLQNFQGKIDFFMMDEIYKINDGNDRGKIFDNILYNLLNKTEYCYLAGPYIDEFDLNLQKKVYFKKYEQELVPKNSIIKNGKLLDIKLNKTGSVIKKIFPFLQGNHQTLVYLGTKFEVEKKSLELAELTQIKPLKINVDIAKYLVKYIDKSYPLILCLLKGIGFHHRGMPKFLQNWIINLFNKGYIKTLFCTSTIIEGVNTTAEVIIIADNKKGKRKSCKLTDFDRKNIYGRAGRFGKYFSGYVIDLFGNEEYEHSDDFSVESNYSDVKKIKNKELYKYLDPIDHTPEIKEYVDNENNELNTIVLGLPEILKRNKFVKEEDQISFVKYVLGGKKFNFNGKKEDFISILHHVAHFFGKTEEGKMLDEFHESNMNWAWTYYVKGEPDFIKEYIKYYGKKGKDLGNIIRDMFACIYDIFNFKYPKYLSCFQNLYNIIAQQENFSVINLDHVIKKLEYGYVETHEILLKNWGVPEPLISKIGKYFEKCVSIKELEDVMKNNIIKNKDVELEEFEKEYIRDILKIK